ncbi:hypothetical protein ACFX5K_02905 [Rickettsiales bacterium LUAb2]
MVKFYILREIISFLLLSILTIILLFLKISTFSTVLFALFYVIIYSLATNNLMSFFSIILLSLIFDSINDISLGVTAVILLTIIFLYKIEVLVVKYSEAFIVKYILAIINFGLLILGYKILSIFFQVNFFNTWLFYLISIVSLLFSTLILNLLTKK